MQRKHIRALTRTHEPCLIIFAFSSRVCAGEHHILDYPACGYGACTHRNFLKQGNLPSSHPPPPPSPPPPSSPVATCNLTQVLQLIANYRLDVPTANKNATQLISTYQLCLPSGLPHTSYKADIARPCAPPAREREERGEDKERREKR